jgi:hypothetical protein
MNKTNKILSAFAVGAIAGTLLGILLKSSENAGLKKITGQDNKKRASLLERLFGRKKDNRSREDFKRQVRENEQEYEEA